MGVGVEIDLTDEDARRVLRYALGSRLTQTHEKLIGSLGTLETQGLCTAVEMLVQLAEQSEGCLWELQLSDLLEPVRHSYAARAWETTPLLQSTTFIRTTYITG